MKPNLIPLVWDNGRIGSVVADTDGILRLRHAIDAAMELEFELARGANKLPSMAPPFHPSPRIDGAELTALIDKLDRHRT